ncbi:MAG: Gfo/Idh/MocA family oxidoreductase [Planctomycetes bacterium]|nr:Gfo/Idh/MocA family oxidoreductase [Planctomycetota bacterium]
MSIRITRRGLLKGTAAAGAGLVLLPNAQSVWGYAQNKKLNVALVGVGGQAKAGHGMAGSENVVAICDADTHDDRLGLGVKKWPDAKAYTDWRKIYDNHKDLNLVLVATPDHTHFPAAYSAIIRGAACYCEKPLTHGIWEARTLAEATRKHRVPTQMGNQGHAKEGNRRVVEWVRAGAIGDVKEVHTWTNRAGKVWPQGKLGPFKEAPVPAFLDWNAWLGVAPQRNFFVNEKGESPVAPWKWRGWFDYGCGAVGDMGCHTWDSVWWSMDPRAPLSAEPMKIVELGTETFPLQMIVKWEFGPSAPDSPFKRPGFTAYWYESGLKPEVPEEIKNDDALPAGKRQLPNTGSLFIGTKGKLVVAGDYGDTPYLIPTATFEAFKTGDMQKIEKIPKSIGHREELMAACRGEQPWDYPKSNFMYAGPLVEAMLLANVAVRLGQKVTWDAKNLKCPGCPKADVLIKRPYRKSFWDIG